MFKVEFERLNDAFVLKNLNIDFCNNKFEYTYQINDTNSKSVAIKSEDYLFYRRGHLNFPFVQQSELKRTLDVENSFIEDIIFEKSQYIKSDILNNKILNLKIANQCGFCIPKTKISNHGDDISLFFNKSDFIATKPISNHHINFYDRKLKKRFFSPGTIVIPKQYAQNSSFGISLFQEYIEKKFEIRVFVFESLIFSSAIFSQQNEKTKYDYRNYDSEKPNRVVPFNLPNNIKTKILKFMKIKNLSTGSFDLIYSVNNEYVFLEVNPLVHCLPINWTIFQWRKFA